VTCPPNFYPSISFAAQPGETKTHLREPLEPPYNEYIHVFASLPSLENTALKNLMLLSCLTYLIFDNNFIEFQSGGPMFFDSTPLYSSVYIFDENARNYIDNGLVQVIFPLTRYNI
jgi:hypothetical protein